MNQRLCTDVVTNGGHDKLSGINMMRIYTDLIVSRKRGQGGRGQEHQRSLRRRIHLGTLLKQTKSQPSLRQWIAMGGLVRRGKAYKFLRHVSTT